MESEHIMKKILTLILGLIPSIALAEPIKLKGIDISMSVEQQKETLTKFGYNCADPNKFGCNKKDKLIVPSDKTIVFTCENFNACSYTLKEFAQAIVDNGVVSGLDYEPKLYGSGSTSKLVEQFCGKGPDGDVLCVIADKFGSKILLKVTIEKGTLGKGGIKID